MNRLFKYQAVRLLLRGTTTLSMKGCGIHQTRTDQGQAHSQLHQPGVVDLTAGGVGGWDVTTLNEADGRAALLHRTVHGCEFHSHVACVRKPDSLALLTNGDTDYQHPQETESRLQTSSQSLVASYTT